MIETLHELECKLGRLPYAYEIEQYTGQSVKSVQRWLTVVGDYPSELRVTSVEKVVLDYWNSGKTARQIGEIMGKAPSQISQYLLILNKKGVIGYSKRKPKTPPKPKKKPLTKTELILRKINKPLKPLPTKRVWQPDPCSGMIGGYYENNSIRQRYV